jgi:biotin carboxyl carrier protein
MKLIAETDNEKHALDVQRESARVSATIGSRSYQIEVRKPEAGAYVFIVSGRVFECRVDKSGATRGAYQVHVGGDTYNIALSDPKRLRDAKSSGADADGRVPVVAPMPGKVVRVLVEQGAEVVAGDGLVIVEAMKMQNEMKSPKAGTVAEIHAQAGATVSAGEVLIVVE